MLRVVSQQKRRFYARAELACARCAGPIYMFGLGELDDVVEARCEACRHLGLYRKARVTVRLLPERRRLRPPAVYPRLIHPQPNVDDEPQPT
jgi:hypothetical protein